MLKTSDEHGLAVFDVLLSQNCSPFGACHENLPDCASHASAPFNRQPIPREAVIYMKVPVRPLRELAPRRCRVSKRWEICTVRVQHRITPQVSSKDPHWYSPRVLGYVFYLRVVYDQQAFAHPPVKIRYVTFLSALSSLNESR